MSSSSVIFHNGLRCTKVPRKSAAATPSASSPEPAASGSAASNTSPDPGPRQGTETSDPLTSSKSSELSSETSQLPLVVPSTTTITTSKVTTAWSTDSTSSKSSSSSSTASGLPNQSSSAALDLSTIRTATATDSNPTSTLIGGDPFETNSSQEHSGLSNGDGSQESLRTLLGSVLGGMGFIALVFLSFLLFYRYRRRKAHGSWRSLGGSEKLLHGGRGSPDSGTGLQHGHRSNMSVYSDSSSIRSLYNYITQQQPLVGSPLTATASNGHHTRFSNPFSDSAEMHRGSLSSIQEVMQGPLIDTSDPNSSHNLPMQPAALPRRAYSADWGLAMHDSARNHGHPAVQFPFGISDASSVHGSERSLGSTVILPGRSSMGSSLRRFSYQVSLAEMGAGAGAGGGGPSEPVTRVSTRSDPFDLEVPAKAMHRRSSGALPLGTTLQQV